MPCPITSVQTMTSSVPSRAASSWDRRASGGSLPKMTDARAPAACAAAASARTDDRLKATTATKRRSATRARRNDVRSPTSPSKVSRDRRAVRSTSKVPSATFASKTRSRSGRASTGPQTRTCRYRPDFAAMSRRVQAWPRQPSTHQWTSSNTSTSPSAGATSAVQHSTDASASSDSSPVQSPTPGAILPHFSATRSTMDSRTSQASARSGPA
mmetsp:Transcript_12877/g.43919  ORF Transcript_12877/g.43919 Transcript_12877/m.43919 type:complete len:213 (-) Transcript_12877:295-933(-)